MLYTLNNLLLRVFYSRSPMPWLNFPMPRTLVLSSFAHQLSLVLCAVITLRFRPSHAMCRYILYCAVYPNHPLSCTPFIPNCVTQISPVLCPILVMQCTQPAQCSPQCNCIRTHIYVGI